VDQPVPSDLDHVDLTPHHTAIRCALAESEEDLRQCLLQAVASDPAVAAVMCEELLRLESWLPIGGEPHPSAGPEIDAYTDRALGLAFPLDPSRPCRDNFAIYADRVRSARAALKLAEELQAAEEERKREALHRLVGEGIPDFVADGAALRASFRRCTALSSAIPWLKKLEASSRAVLEREADRLLLLRVQAAVTSREKGSHAETVRLAAEGHAQLSPGVSYHDYYVYEPEEGAEALIPTEYTKPTLVKKTLPSGRSGVPPTIPGLRVERRITVEVRG
jgi:hypothetical protein